MGLEDKVHKYRVRETYFRNHINNKNLELYYTVCVNSLGYISVKLYFFSWAYILLEENNKQVNHILCQVITNARGKTKQG